MKKFSIGLALFLVAIVTVSAAGVEAEALTPPQVKARSQVTPFYPATASFVGIEATVVLRADIGTDGRIAGLSVLDCDRPELGFEQSAIDAVRHWRFKPASRDGQPVGATTLVTLQIAPPLRGGFGEARTAASFDFTSGIGALSGAQPKNPERARPNGGPHMDKIRKADRQTDCTDRKSLCSYDRKKLNRTRRLVPLPRNSGGR